MESGETKKRIAKRRKIENIPWKAGHCFSPGESCWCRSVLTDPPKGKSRTFIPGACIGKEEAELIVKIHNEWLEMKSGKNKSSK